MQPSILLRMQHRPLIIVCQTDAVEFTITYDTFDGEDARFIVLSQTLYVLTVMNVNIKHLDVSRCTNLRKLRCQGNNITKLTLNDNLNLLYCSNNKLTKLALNKELLGVDCSENYLETIKLNRNLRELYCEKNKLTRLNLNKGLRFLLCSYNNLTHLVPNKNLLVLFCEYNKLTKLRANEELLTLGCNNNQLTELILNENLRALNCNGNQLISLTLNDRLNKLRCTQNKLTTLTLNKTLSKRTDDDMIRYEVDRHVIIVPEDTFPDFRAYIPTSADDVCAICYDADAEGLIKTDCNHIFHLQCIFRIHNAHCPYCRTEIAQLK